MKKNIGQIIRECLEARNMDVTQFAYAIHKERSNVYNIFKRDSIDTDLLKKIGQVLDYDFFQHFLEPETIENIRKEQPDKPPLIVKNARVLLEIELNDEDIEKIGLSNKMIDVLKKQITP